MECFWLGPEDAALPFTLPDVEEWEQQRRAAARAALAMAEQSGFDETDSEGGESEEEDYDEFGWPLYGSAGPRYTLLKEALLRFNEECEEGAKFQWFNDTIEGPLVLQEVRGHHRRGCEVCEHIPGLGELFFRYNIGVHGAPWSCSKLCMTCGMGILYAAVEQLDAGRGPIAGDDDADADDAEGEFGLGPHSDQPQSADEEDSAEDFPEQQQQRRRGRQRQQQQQQRRGMPAAGAPAGGAAAAAVAGAAGSSRRGAGAADAAEQPVPRRQRR